jgi:hypothetical protein
VVVSEFGCDPVAEMLSFAIIDSSM